MSEMSFIKSLLRKSQERSHDTARQIAQAYLDKGEFVLVTMDKIGQASIVLHSADFSTVKRKQEELAAEEKELDNDLEEEGDYEKIILLAPVGKLKIK